jgi:type IV pilus assembly protein PilC
MPEFLYQALDERGKRQKGQLSAPTKGAAIHELKRRGLIPRAVEEKQKSIWQMEITIGKPVKTEDFVIYCRQFSTLIRAGVSIVDATNILSNQSESKALRETLTDVTDKLRKGMALSEAIADHPKIFPPIFINMVKAGETAGNLDEVLDRLAVQFEKDYFTIEKVKSAMTYPIIVGIVAICSVAFLLIHVVPQFAGMLTAAGTEIPALTRGVMSLSASLSERWYFWLVGLAALILAYRLLLRMPKGRYTVDYIKLRMPVFGVLFRKAAIARFTRTLGSLFHSSVPVLQALTVVEKVIGNEVIAEVINRSKESLRQGQRLSDPLRKSWVFPPLVTQMIAIGEETGAMDQMLGKIADFYEADVENTVDKIKSLIEPLLLLVVSGIVGTIIASILMPMFKIYETIH